MSTATKRRSKNSKRFNWTDDKVKIIVEKYPHQKTKTIAIEMGCTLLQIYVKARALGIKKSDAFLQSEDSGRLTKGCPVAIDTRFKAGNKPWNKGVRFNAGGRSHDSQFKRNHSPHNTKAIGSYRLNKDGHLQQKIGDAKGSNSKRWRSVAELVWCAVNGQLPAKHIVVFKPKMFTDKLEEITIDRVECLSLSDNARRNSAWNKDPKMAALYQLKGQIKRQLNRIKKDQKNEQ